MEGIDPRPEAQALLASIKQSLPSLEQKLEEWSGHWTYEDGIYRFYHQSFKVYGLQRGTADIVKSLEELRPGEPLNPWFLEIVREGTGKQFRHEHNERWLQETRPIVEAFMHAKYFLEMTVKYGKEFSEAPSCLPSGWASVLYLYNLR